MLANFGWLLELCAHRCMEDMRGRTVTAILLYHTSRAAQLPSPSTFVHAPYPTTATALISTSSSGLAKPLMMSSVFGG